MHISQCILGGVTGSHSLMMMSSVSLLLLGRAQETSKLKLLLNTWIRSWSHFSGLLSLQTSSSTIHRSRPTCSGLICPSLQLWELYCLHQQPMVASTMAKWYMRRGQYQGSLLEALQPPVTLKWISGTDWIDVPSWRVYLGEELSFNSDYAAVQSELTSFLHLNTIFRKLTWTF